MKEVGVYRYGWAYEGSWSVSMRVAIRRKSGVSMRVGIGRKAGVRDSTLSGTKKQFRLSTDR